MLNRIISFSIHNKLIVGLFIIALAGYGLYEVKHLPIDAVPDITNNQVQVITVAPALGAPDVERLITFPVEQVNNNIPGIIEMRSFSRFGLSVVTIVFNDKTDVYWARQQVAERLQQVQDQIPQGVGTPVLAPVTTGLGEIYQYVVKPKKGYENKYSPMELRTIQDWIVRRQLLGVQGVAEVSSFGGLLKQYEIAVDPEKLMANNLTITDIYDALEKNNQNTGGSYIEKGPVILFIRSEGLVGSLDDIGNIVVKNLENGSPLLIRDVAGLSYGHAPRYGAMTWNGEQQVSGAIVMMLKGANSNEVIKNIKERIGHIRKMLPEGVEIEPFLDRTKMVNNAITTVSRNLIEGALIVVFVLVLFLGNLRAGLLVASVIPLSMLFAVTLMNIFGVSGNLMSLGALDFGLIVDGAVIIVEAVMHKLSHSKMFAKVNRLNQRDMDDVVGQSASRMMNSAVFGQIIILVVYLPILTLQGIEGKMFKPMAQTVVFALLGAFLLSLTYIPMMGALFLSKKAKHEQGLSDRIMARIEDLYQRFFVRSLRYQKLILIVVFFMFVLSLFVFSRMGGEFIPSLPEGDFAVDTRVLPGSNLNTSIEAVSQASKILLGKFPEVDKVVGKTGSSEVPTDPMAVYESDMMVILKPRKEWKSAKTYSELEAKMAKELEAVPGVTFGFQYPVAMRFNELISGARQDVVCKIFGEDLDTLAFYADKLAKICNTVEGSEALYVEAVTGMPQIVVSYNRERIAQYGLNISDLNRTVNAAFAGETSGTVYEGEKRFDLVVRMTGEKRQHLEDVQNMLVATTHGTQIPLSTVADIRIIEGPNQIQRENSQRRIIVGFNVRGRDIQSTVHELQQKVEKDLKLQAGYYITYGGAFENLEAAKERLFVAVPLALMLIFLLLYFTFHSIGQGLLIYTAIPLSAIGGIFALALRGIPFSVSATIGFIALFGVAVLNGIVLIAEFNRLHAEGYTNLKRIVIVGTRTRLRPVLMTALVASLGFLPMAVSKGEGAEVQRPLATVVIGGLLVATFLTLYVLPVFYMFFHKRFGPKRNKTLVLGAMLFMLLMPFSDSIAQTPVRLDQAIDTALKNNLDLKNERLRAGYHQALIRSSFNIPMTRVFSEYGQMNSPGSDVKFGIEQSFSFPTVYRSQKWLMQEEWKTSLTASEVGAALLKKQVTQVYLHIDYLGQKQQVLNEVDSIFKVFLDKTRRRLAKGETLALEVAAAENQLGEAMLQLVELEKDRNMALRQLQLLLNSKTLLVPSEQNIVLHYDQNPDKAALQNHPRIQLAEQQEVVAEAGLKAERAKLLPEISLGYYRQGISGLGSDGVVYDAQPRFQSVMIGLQLPLVSTAQKSRIHAAKMNVLIAQTDFESSVKSFQVEFDAALAQYQKWDAVVRHYEETALKNAGLLIATANHKIIAGQINYLEWSLLIGQAVAIKTNYIDAMFERNRAVVELKYLVNN